MEAESRKIGSVSVPSFLLNRIKTGPRLLLNSALEERVRRIERDYPLLENRDSILRLLSNATTFKERLGGKKVKLLSDLLSCGEVSQFIEIMLTDYYDPLYKRHIDNTESEHSFLVKDPKDAAIQIQKWVQEKKMALST